MAQPHSNNFGGYHTHGNNIQQEQSSNARMGGHTQPLPHPRVPHSLRNLPAEVRLPPTMLIKAQPEFNHPHVPPRSLQRYPMNNGEVQSVSPMEVLHLLELAEKENSELKDAIHSNNQILTSKINSLEKLIKDNEVIKEEKALFKMQLKESTNQFFEARVAVLGFKCRVMQLQAQSESKVQSAPPVPAQPIGPHEINAQIGTLNFENKKLLDENKSLEAVILAQRQNESQLRDKKKIVEEETERHKAKVEELENELKEITGKLGEAQTHSFVQHSTRAELSQQVRILENDNRRVQTQYHTVSQQNTSLQSQVQGLKATEKEYAQKLHQLEQASQPPVPRPRINVPQGELDKLRDDQQTLRKKLENERESRQSVEVSLTKKGDQYQELLMKYNREKTQLQSENDSLKEQQDGDEAGDEVQRLADELTALKVSDISKEQSIRQKDIMIQRITTERSDLLAKVANLEKHKHSEIAAIQQGRREEVTVIRKVKDDYEGTIANLKEKLRLATGVKGGVSSLAVARRLNDTLGKVKELETKLANQSRDFEQDREKFEKDNLTLREEVTQIQGEMTQIQGETGNDLTNITERLEYCEDEMVRLETSKGTLLVENTSIKMNLEQVREELGQQIHLLEAKSRECTEVQSQLQEILREKEKKQTKLVQLTDTFSEVKDDLHNAQDRARTAEADKKRSDEANAHLVQNVQQLNETGDIVMREKKQLEDTVTQFKGELSSIMGDYQVATDRLQTAESELERIDMEKKLLETELYEKSTRIKKIENERKTIQDRVTHMDAQLSMFREDFEREREAREAAVKVKNMLDERLNRKEGEVKDLRERINQQAQHTLRRDSQEQYDSPSPSRVRSGEHQPGGHQPLEHQLGGHHPGGHQLGGQHLGGPYPSNSGEYRRSQEIDRQSPHFSRDQQQHQQQQQQQTGPPLPPRIREYGEEVAWTQQMAPVQTPPPRMRPSTSAHEPIVGGGDIPRQYHQHPQLPTRGPGDQDQISYSGQPMPPGNWRAAPPHEDKGGRNDLSDSGLQQRNNFSELLAPGELPNNWVGPGEVTNIAPPSMACPICQQQNFHTQTDLELHCAQCT